MIGYARDGGLYVPESIPKISKDEIEEWSALSYPELVKKIMPLFISSDEIPVSDLHRLIDRSFKKFPGKLFNSSASTKGGSESQHKDWFYFRS